VSEFLTIVGALAILLGLACVLIGLYLTAMEIRERRAQRIRGHAHARAYREIGAEMKLGAHWYFEGRKNDAALLVDIIGDYMMTHGVYREDPIREIWRRKRAEPGDRADQGGGA